MVNGVSYSEVLFSTWKAVDASHNASSLNIDFPQCHAKQKQIAREFKQTSAAGFDDWCGRMDELLMLINKPITNDVSVSSEGPKIFFMGTKVSLFLIHKVWATRKEDF